MSMSFSPCSGVLRRGRMIFGLLGACRKIWERVNHRESISEAVTGWNRMLCIYSGFPRTRE